MEELSAELDAKLVKIREDYEERKNDADDLEFRAMTSGISVSQVLEALEEEKEEEERVVIRDINLERDGAMARKLQAEDSVEDDSGPYLISSSPPPPITSTLPPISQMPIRPHDMNRFDSPGFRPASSIPRPPDPLRAQQYTPGVSFPPWRGPLDDDIQEISGNSFNSQLGYQFGDPRGYGHAPYPSFLAYPRHIPWAADPAMSAMTKLEGAEFDMGDDDGDME